VGFLGFGIRTVAEEVRHLIKTELPGVAKSLTLEIVDQGRLQKDKNDTLRKAWTSGQIQVLIGTQVLAKRWEGKNVGLVGIISADTLLHFPDFRSNERTFQLLTSVVDLAAKSNPPGIVILQTFLPDNSAIEAVKNGDYVNFYRREIEARKKIVYPPFCALVKLKVKDRDEQKARLLAAQAVRELNTAQDLPVRVIGPGKSFVFKYRGYFYYQIVLKVLRTAEINFRDLLKEISVDFDVDVNPDNLL
jgi:primosomal protein N' (replication factor Y)